MTLDMYSEKVAETSALIREFAKVDYFHYFARDPESSLEAFIAMQDSAHAAGRASALAELHPQWLAEKERADRAEKNFAELSNASVALNNQHVAEQERQAERIAGLEAALLESRANDRAAMTHLAEAKSRIADLERQLAEASPPAVEQPIGHISKGMLEQLRERLGVSGYVQSGRTEEFPVAIYAAPQAADTDKVREALKDVIACFDAAEIEGLSIVLAETTDERLKDLIERRVMHARYAAEEALTMAAQAPVREVPEPIRKFLVEVSQQHPEKPDYWSECGQCGTRRDQADELLEQFPAAIAREVPGWISVDERLPEYGAEVLVFQPEKECKVTALARFTSNVWDYYWDAAHIGKGRMTRPASVTHWMTLPAAPVQQEGSGDA